MNDYEKISGVRRDLEDIRADLCRRISEATSDSGDLTELHARISRAIKALSGRG